MSSQSDKKKSRGCCHKGKRTFHATLEDEREPGYPNGAQQHSGAARVEPMCHTQTKAKWGSEKRMSWW